MKSQLIVASALLLMPSTAIAAAGISDYVHTRACWVREPYALVKNEIEAENYAAELVLARATTPEEDSSWSFMPQPT